MARLETVDGYSDFYLRMRVTEGGAWVATVRALECARAFAKGCGCVGVVTKGCGRVGVVAKGCGRVGVNGVDYEHAHVAQVRHDALQ